jgi:hypothetical protein
VQAAKVSLVDRAQQRLPLDLRKYVPALRKFFATDFFRGWEIAVAISHRESVRDVPPLDSVLSIEPKCPDKGVEGEHWLSLRDRPSGVVGVADTLAAGDLLSDVIPHELGEMVVDPTGALCIAINEAQTEFVAVEPFDPVQALPGEAPGVDRIEIDRFLFPNFVLPAWFDFRRKACDGPFDLLGKCSRPLELLPGGYISEFRQGKWEERFCSSHARAHFDLRPHARVRRRGNRG